MKPRSPQELVAAALLAPIGVHLKRPDTQIIQGPSVEQWYQIVTPSCRHRFLNEVIFSQIEDARVDLVIAEVIQHYRSLGVSFKWCVGPTTRPLDMGDRLAKLGFSSIQVKGMVIDPATFESSISERVSVEEVGPSQVADFAATYIEGWAFEDAERDAIQKSILKALETESSTRKLYLARLDGVPAGTASFLLKGDLAYLTGGNVLPRFQKKGVYVALIHSRLKRLQALGVTLATTQARTLTSAPILERLGFRPVFETTIYQSPD